MDGQGAQEERRQERHLGRQARVGLAAASIADRGERADDESRDGEDRGAAEAQAQSAREARERERPDAGRRPHRTAALSALPLCPDQQADSERDPESDGEGQRPRQPVVTCRFPPDEILAHGIGRERPALDSIPLEPGTSVGPSFSARGAATKPRAWTRPRGRFLAPQGTPGSRTAAAP